MLPQSAASSRVLPSLEEPMSSLQNLTEVSTALESTVGPAVFGPLASRVLLRTGVSLRKPRPDQLTDPAAVSKVVHALADMGYRL